MSSSPSPPPYGETYFFNDTIPDAPFALNAEESHHLRHVLRQKEGAVIYVTDGAGALAEAELTGWKNETAQLRPLSRRQTPAPAPHISLGLGLLPKPAMERLIEHVSQFPLSSIIPLSTDHTRIECDCFEKLLPRYRRLSLTALKQSKKAWITDVKTPVDFKAALHWKTAYDIVYLFESAGAVERPEEALLRKAGKILLLVGPEGGFSASEVAAAKEAGISVLSLGPTRLRAETAGIAAVVSVLTLLGRNL